MSYPQQANQARYRWGLLALVLIAPFAAIASPPEDPLGDLRWKSRVLLVFTSGSGDARATPLFDALSDAACAVAERHIIAGRVSVAGDSYLGKRALTPEAVPRLRRRFRIAPDAFRIVLIGKDGGVKAEYYRPPPLAEVFALIDGMPMRRQEMREQARSCVD